MAKQTDNFDAILQECLEKVQKGEETLDSVLARYPAFADELRPSLEAALWIQSRKKTLEPRPGFVNASRHRLVEQIRQEQSAVPARGARRWWAGLNDVLVSVYSQQRHALQFVAALVLVVALIAGSTGVARASQNALPGELLYRVKRAVEKTELAFTLDEADKARLNVRNAERRLVEIQYLLLADQTELVSETVALFEENVHDAMQSMILVGELDIDKAQELVSTLDSGLHGQTQLIRVLASTAPDEVQGELDRLLLVAGGVADLAAENIPSIDPTATSTTTSTATSTLTVQVPTDTSIPPSNTPTQRPSPEVVISVTPTPTGFFASTATSTPGIDARGKPPTDTPTPTLKSKPTKTPRPEKTKKPLPNPPRRPPKTEK